MDNTVLVIGVLGLALGDTPSETLTYDILVDGSRSGSMTRSITSLPNNDIQYQTQAHTAVRYLFLSFRYQFSGAETWKGNSIVSLLGDCNDDGTRYHIRLHSTATGKTLIRNRQESSLAEIPWTTGGCRPPPGEGTFLTLDPDTGVTRKTRFSKLPRENYPLNGTSIPATPWSSDLPGNARFLFDDTGKLLQQSWKEQGRRVEIRLFSVQTN